VLFALLLSSVDRHELGAQLARTSWAWALVGVVLGLAALYARAFRWRWLFPPGTPPAGIIPATMIGYMANNVLPLRAGELVRIYAAARRLRATEPLTATEAFWLVAATVVIERVMDSLAIVLILGILVFLIPVPAGVEWGAAVLLTIDVVGVALLVTAARAPQLGRRLVAAFTGRWPRLARMALAMFDTALRGLDGVRSPAHAVRIAGWTVVIWTLSAAAAWAMLRAVHLDLAFIAGWVVLAFVGLGISVPSAPGYLGVWHFAAKLALEIFGVASSASVAYALVYHASAVLPVTLVGWLYLLREHVSLGEARRAPTPVP
jgi:uncharacterized protein (TIRG00374 family)